MRAVLVAAALVALCLLHSVFCDEWQDEAARMRAENDELRELCHELYEFMSRADRMQWPEVIDRMRRLGIEVDE